MNKVEFIRGFKPGVEPVIKKLVDDAAANPLTWEIVMNEVFNIVEQRLNDGESITNIQILSSVETWHRMPLVHDFSRDDFFIDIEYRE